MIHHISPIYRNVLSFVIPAVFLFITGCDNDPKPDLIVDHITVQSWTQEQMLSSVAIRNIGNVPAENVRVYFNLEENPESQNHRPQFRRVVETVNVNQQITWSVYWNHPVNGLQHPDNQNLANVTGITIIVDPKSEIDELDETNNTSSVNVWPSP